jgi:hypothetical protein
MLSVLFLNSTVDAIHLADDIVHWITDIDAFGCGSAKQRT